MHTGDAESKERKKQRKKVILLCINIYNTPIVIDALIRVILVGIIII